MNFKLFSHVLENSIRFGYKLELTIYVISLKFVEILFFKRKKVKVTVKVNARVRDTLDFLEALRSSKTKNFCYYFMKLSRSLDI